MGGKRCKRSTWKHNMILRLTSLFCNKKTKGGRGGRTGRGKLGGKGEMGGNGGKSRSPREWLAKHTRLPMFNHDPLFLD